MFLKPCILRELFSKGAGHHTLFGYIYSINDFYELIESPQAWKLSWTFCNEFNIGRHGLKKFSPTGVIPLQLSKRSSMWKNSIDKQTEKQFQMCQMSEYLKVLSQIIESSICDTCTSIQSVRNMVELNRLTPKNPERAWLKKGISGGQRSNHWAQHLLCLDI